MKYSLWVISKGMLFRKDPINQNYRVTKKKKENKKKTYLYSKVVWLRILMPFTLKGLVQDEALQKVLMSENDLNETSY